jgi:hypothetical protein
MDSKTTTVDYLRLTTSEAFSNMSWGRDMLIATFISATTAIWQLRTGVAAAAFKKPFLFSVVVPYVVVLGGHLFWRVFVSAPHALHNRTAEELHTMGNVVAQLTLLSEDDPHVIVEFNPEKLPFFARGKWIGERPVYLKNVGKHKAYKVQIGEIVWTVGGARFPRQELLEPDEPEPIRAELVFPNDSGPSGVSEFEVLLQAEWEVTDWPAAKSDLRRPMVIRYEDHIGNRFMTRFYVTYGLKNGIAASDFEFEKSLKPYLEHQAPRIL